MSLIKSISGIRGTIGGTIGDNLTPVDIVKFTLAFAEFLKKEYQKEKITIVIGRDARVSGEMVNHLIVGTLMGCGADVIDGGLSTTPTIEMAVVQEHADGGIIITASHNPAQWNALKLLNAKGEFLSAADGEKVLQFSKNQQITFSEISHLGKYTYNENFIEQHIQKILALPLVDTQAIKAMNFKVAIDCINSTGGIAIPALLKALGVSQIEYLYCDPTGVFEHNPEPLPENLHAICKKVIDTSSDIGFVVDPDVDRLAIIMEDGNPFGEEYTLVAIADYILSCTKGNTVSNLSSTRALQIVTEKHGATYASAAVGEVNVVEKMKETQAIIGGEGNGGVIYPELHYGRDALVGIALMLTFLAKNKTKCSSLRERYPNFYISKNKIELSQEINVDLLLKKIKERYAKYPISIIDGVRIDFENEWVHLRKSNTEPIIRIYAESDSMVTAEHLAKQILEDMREIINQTK